MEVTINGVEKEVSVDEMDEKELKELYINSFAREE